MFSSADSVGTRLNAWKMKPMRSRRSCVSCLSFSLLTSTSPTNTAPDDKRVEPGETVHQRRLAGARRAHDRGEAAGAELDRHAVERTDFGLAAAVDLGDVDGASSDQCRAMAQWRGGWIECCGHGFPLI